MKLAPAHAQSVRHQKMRSVDVSSVSRKVNFSASEALQSTISRLHGNWNPYDVQEMAKR